VQVTYRKKERDCDFVRVKFDLVDVVPMFPFFFRSPSKHIMNEKWSLILISSNNLMSLDELEGWEVSLLFCSICG
jgi:hypothetical protein